MTPELKDLARQVIGLPGWTWPDGMRWTVFRAPPHEPYSGRIGDGWGRSARPGALPDLTDAATAGLLYQMLGDDPERIKRDGGEWYAWVAVDGYEDDLWLAYEYLGEACARVAVSVGRWAGGGK
jgi:hypothetical protein